MTSAAQRYRKKPVEVEAMRFTGSNGATIALWAKEHARPVSEMHAPLVMAVYTLHGVTKAEIGDWIVRGPSGDYWPVKADIFEETYEPA